MDCVLKDLDDIFLDTSESDCAFNLKRLDECGCGLYIFTKLDDKLKEVMKIVGPDKMVGYRLAPFYNVLDQYIFYSSNYSRIKMVDSNEWKIVKSLLDYWEGIDHRLGIIIQNYNNLK